MEKHRPDINITPSFLKKNKDVLYVVPGCVKNRTVPNNKFFLLNKEKLDNIIYVPIIDDITDPNHLCYCKPHKYIINGPLCPLKTAIQSMAYQIGVGAFYREAKAIYIEDIKKIDCNTSKCNLDCCHIEDIYKTEFELYLEKVKNVFFLWPKKTIKEQHA